MSAEPMIVVSGAASGIGRAVTRRLVSDGGRVLAAGRRPEPVQRLAAELGRVVRPVLSPNGGVVLGR
ncbi:MAG: SDR family NAD(P)-dependent oxidoreductase [Streptosporangiaceae bacterium]